MSAMLLRHLRDHVTSPVQAALSIAIAISVSLVLLMATEILYTTARQDSLLRASQGNPNQLAMAIFEARGGGRRQCAAQAFKPEGDLERLASAIEVAEGFFKTRSERLVEDVLVRATVALGLPIPDLSIGEGQIRISTAQRAALALTPADSLDSRPQIALKLLDQCQNHAYAMLVLRWLADKRDMNLAALRRSDVVTLAADYNGQRVRVPEAAAPSAQTLSAATYNLLVYHLFYDIAFGEATERPSGFASAQTETR